MTAPTITLHNMDCMKYMATLPDKAFDLAIVDPPYGINMAQGHKGSIARGDAYRYKAFHGCDTSIPKQAYFAELRRVSNQQIIWGGNYMTEHLPPCKGFVIWDKEQPETFRMAMCEFAWTSFDVCAKLVRIRVVGADPDRIHPTQKPVALYRWLLRTYAKPGWKILDTHLGSGSIALACHDLGYDLVGTELDTDYFNAAVKRLDNHRKQERMDFQQEDTP